MRRSLILLILLYSLLPFFLADNVNTAYTDYTWGDPNKCTVINDDSNKVYIFSYSENPLEKNLAQPFISTMLQK